MPKVGEISGYPFHRRLCRHIIAIFSVPPVLQEGLAVALHVAPEAVFAFIDRVMSILPAQIDKALTEPAGERRLEVNAVLGDGRSP